MINTNLTYFEIDLADIWNYACESYSADEKNAAAYKDLYYYLVPIYLAHDLKPFLSPETVASGKYSQDYYDNYFYERSKQLELGYIVYIFESQGSFYRMLTPCPIKQENTNHLAYQRLFSLKLSQYKHGLYYIKDFLSYHFSKSFNENQKQYYEFLRLALIQWGNMLEKSVIDEVNNLLSNGEPLPKWESPAEDTYEYYLQALSPKPIMANTDIPENRETSSELPSTIIPIKIDGEVEQTSEPKENPDPKNKLPPTWEFNEVAPENYEIIEGKFSRKETFEFFSFLFKEKSVNNKPFLDEAAVADIFKYGIAIPPHGSFINRHKLNISKNYPKSIIEYAMHKYYIKHTDGGRYNKAHVLQFLCYYFEDFAYALESDQKLRTFIGNITGEKPIKMAFDIDLYIPERIRKSEIPKHLISKKRR